MIKIVGLSQSHVNFDPNFNVESTSIKLCATYETLELITAIHQRHFTEEGDE